MRNITTLVLTVTILAAGTLAACVERPPKAPERPPKAPEKPSVGQEFDTCRPFDTLCVSFRNDLSDVFEPQEYWLSLDGSVFFTGLPQKQIRDHVFFTQQVSAGEHRVQVVLRFQGRPPLNGYRFEIKSSHDLTLEPQKTLHLSVFAYEKGTETTPLEARPTVRYAEEQTPP